MKVSQIEETPFFLVQSFKNSIGFLRNHPNYSLRLDIYHKRWIQDVIINCKDEIINKNAKALGYQSYYKEYK